MSKQTSVEWLVEQLKEYDFADIKDDENYVLKIPAWILTEKEEQAKAMEKEQIIKAFCEGYDHDGDNYDGAEISYYNRTYKGGDK
jgi:hypothetical protein